MENDKNKKIDKLNYLKKKIGCCFKKNKPQKVTHDYNKLINTFSDFNYNENRYNFIDYIISIIKFIEKNHYLVNTWPINIIYLLIKNV